MEEKIEKYAKELGFDLVGFTSGKLPKKYIKKYEKWIVNGCQANMKYMEKPRPRHDPTAILPNAKSVIVLGVNYYYDQPKLKSAHGRVARYAYGHDYHKAIGKMLKKLKARIAELDTKAKTVSYVDTGPVLERAYAEQAGLGFIGKNSCLISQKFGSWIFLAVIFTTLNLTGKRRGDVKIFLQEQSTKMSCGTCTRCIDACPTGAIIAPGVIDARKCISYHTIENRDKIPPEIATQIHKTKRIFGCDICQEICPHNLARQKIIPRENLTQKIAGDQLSLKSLTAIKTDQQFLTRFAGSPLMRAKRKGIQRFL